MLSLELSEVSIDHKDIDKDPNSYPTIVKNETSWNRLESSNTGPTPHTKHTGRSSLAEQSVSQKDKHEEE